MKVSELILKLRTIDPDIRVAVEDADTGWCAPMVDVSVRRVDGESHEVFAVIDPGSYADMLGAFVRDQPEKPK